jgi:hypothetical protein
MENATVLNIAGGKVKPIFDHTPDPMFLVNLDTSYYVGERPDLLENDWNFWKRQETSRPSREYFVNTDIYEFLSRTTMKFDFITIYRFLEHVPFDKVLFFIYLLSTVTEKGSVVDIIVPDYYKLAKMIIEENVDSKTFEAKNILLTTELLNEPSCPHASIWTVDRLDKFFRLEKRFDPLEFNSYKFDGRDIYLRALMIRT